MISDAQSMVPKPWPPWPYECFVGFLLDDFGPDNGGTLLVPGSHKIVTAAGEGPLPPLPPTYARRGYTASRTSVFFPGAARRSKRRRRVTEGQLSLRLARAVDDGAVAFCAAGMTWRPLRNQL